MKWIGQHIWDKISRFRDDVYLESISSGTIASGGNLGLDSNNKIVKATEATGDITAIDLSNGTGISLTSVSGATGGNYSATINCDLEGTELKSTSETDGTKFLREDGDGTCSWQVPPDTNTNQLTTFTLTGDSGSNQTIAHGNTLDIAGGNAISTVVGATDTVTINHDDTSSQASVNNSGRTYIQDITLDTYGHVTGLTSATEVTPTVDSQFTLSSVDGSDSTTEIIRLQSSNNESLDATDITLAVGAGLSIANATNKITFTNTSTQLTTEEVQDIAGPLVATGGTKTNISVTYDDANNNMDFVVENATHSNKGVVELATTGEADTGTDTARAVTPAGLKSHVDARFTYQYIQFVGNADIATNWGTPGTNGPFTHNYNTDTGVNGITVGETSYNFARAKQGGFVVPYDDCVLVGFYGSIRNNTANNQGALGLFHSAYSTYGSKTTTSAFILRAYGTADQTGAAASSYQGWTKVVDLNRNFDLTAGDMILPAIMQASEKAYATFTVVIKTPIL